jgi:hypothetical protein
MLAVVGLEFHVDGYSLFLSSCEQNRFAIFGYETHSCRFVCPLVSIEFSSRHFFILLIHFLVQFLRTLQADTHSGSERRLSFKEWSGVVRMNVWA